MRTPSEISTDAQDLADTSAQQAVPLSLEKVAVLAIEFMVSVAALIELGAPAAVADLAEPAKA